MDQLNQYQCDEQLLRRLVCDDLSARQTEDVERHLDECPACAKQLHAFAAETWPWDEVTDCLPPDEFDSRDDVDSLSVLGCLSISDRDDQSLLSREIAGWLDATDDPQMLGRFAGYEIVGIIGHGGMGIVLKGFEASLNRFVAIKVLAPRLATSGAARKRFAREAKAAAAVRHDNVIAVHRVDEWHGLPFLVMPYVAGVSLQKRIDVEGPLSTEATLRIAAQVAAGLAAAHAQGLVHRDIKPANILLEQGVERVTITDFGLARAVDDASITRSGVIAGTPQFMSPEQAQAKPLDHRSDLFSLGSLIYAMATGRPPFRGEDSTEVLNKIVDEPARDIQEIEPSVPAWLAEAVRSLHAKSPDERPQRASEVAEHLAAWLAHVQQPTTVPEPKPLVPAIQAAKRKPPSNWPRIALGLAGGLFVILATVIIVLETSKGTIRIESEADNVPVRIRIGDKVVDRLTVSGDGTSVRVHAGEYVVEIDREVGNVSVENQTVTVARGKSSITNIRRVTASEVAGQGDSGLPVQERTRDLDFATMTERVDDYVLTLDAIEVPKGDLTPLFPEFPLHQGPLLRWKNPRRATKDGATFLWTCQGRPAVIMSPYWAWDNQRFSHEFQSLHSAPIVAVLDGQAVWTPKNAGIEFQRDPGPQDVSDSRDARLAQMKDIALSFTASAGTSDRPRWGLPLLMEPIYRYDESVNNLLGGENSFPDANVVDGAMFAFAMDGDPEVLLLIEARLVGYGLQWHVAFARMATSALFVTHESEVIWKVNEGKPWDPNETYYSIEYNASDAVRTLSPSSENPDSALPEFDSDDAEASVSKRFRIREVRRVGDGPVVPADLDTRRVKWKSPDGLVEQFTYQQDTLALLNEDDILTFASLHRPRESEPRCNLILNLAPAANRHVADETERMIEDDTTKPVLAVLLDGKVMGIAKLTKPLAGERTIIPVELNEQNEKRLRDHVGRSLFYSPCQSASLPTTDDGITVRTRLVRREDESSKQRQLFVDYSLTFSDHTPKMVEVTFPGGKTKTRLLTRWDNWRFTVAVIDRSGTPPSGKYYVSPRLTHENGRSTVECTLTRLMGDLRPPADIAAPTISFRVLEDNEEEADETQIDPDRTSTLAGEPNDWKQVAPHSITSVKKHGAEILTDKSVQFDLAVSEWAEPALHFSFTELVKISRVRLEILPDTRFPDRRLGREADSVVTLFDLKPTLRREAGKAEAIDFDRCENPADLDDPYVGGLIDYASDTGWKVPSLNPGQNAIEVLFAFEEPLSVGPQDELTLHLDAGGSDTLDVPARVRLSFSDNGATVFDKKAD